MISKEDQDKLNDELLKASEKGNLNEVKELIEKGAKIDARDSNDDIPLHKASTHGHLEVVKYLIEKGNVVDELDRWDKTPLHLASSNGYLDVVKYLIEEKGADIDAHDFLGLSSISCAAKYNKVNVIKYLFLEKNALMPIKVMFEHSYLIKEKMRRKTEAQSIFDYFLQNKSRYTNEEIQYFKKEFLKMNMNDEDSEKLKSIVYFL